jgi:hypothetical protein
MVRARDVSAVLVASALVAVPGAARAAAAPPAVITSDTTLKFGQTGVLKLDGFDGQAKQFKALRAPVGVQVAGIEQGKPSDLNVKGVPTAAKGQVPWYIRSVFSYANADWEGSPPPFLGLFADGSSASALIGADKIGPCVHVDDIILNKQHPSVARCEVVLAPPGEKIVAADTSFNSDAHRPIEVTWK